MSLLSPQLEAFSAVVRNKTVHGAARDLGITQTGVTQRIRTLEGSLSTTLFTRSRRGMLLTDEGEALWRYCLAARDLAGPVLAKLGGAGKEASIKLSITGTCSIMRTRIVPQLIPVMKKYPQLLLEFRILDQETWIDQLRSGQAQIAVVRPELVPNELDSKLLQPERYVLLGPKVWQDRPILDVVKNERIIDFDPSDQMSFAYLKKYRLLQHARPERHFVNSNESLAMLIEAELGYGVFTQEFAERFLQRCQVAILNGGKVFEQRRALAWYPRPNSAPYWSSLIESIH